MNFQEIRSQDTAHLIEVGVIALIIVLCLIFLFKNDKFARSYGTEILTTLGILGCFIGITSALINLKTNDMVNSMPSLLEGIRYAFSSSIAGILGSILLRARQGIFPTKDAEKDIAEGNTLNDVVRAVLSLQKGLVGEEQGTLLTQLKLLRQEQKDTNELLVGEFRNFAKHMVENNQKAIVRALEQVIRDFNQNITEQFGDNFKHLNQAVEKLVLWQAQYKDDLEVIKEAQQKTVNNMVLAVEGLAKFINHAETFSKVSQDLAVQIKFLEENRDILKQQQDAMAQLLTKLSEVTPAFSEKAILMLDAVKEGMSQVAQEASIVTKQLKESTDKNNADLQKTIQSTTLALNETATQTHATLSETVKNLGVQVQQAQAEMKNLLAQVLKENQETTNESLKENVGIIKQGVLALDKALQKELNDALEGLSRQLASLSAKFVEDYSPLTDRLREVVRMSKGV